MNPEQFVKIDKRTAKATGPFGTHEELVAAVKVLKDQGVSNRPIAREFRISPATVSRILGGTKRAPTQAHKEYRPDVSLAAKLRGAWPPTDLSMIETDDEI